jgi:hypothetical protein
MISFVIFVAVVVVVIVVVVVVVFASMNRCGETFRAEMTWDIDESMMIIVVVIATLYGFKR